MTQTGSSDFALLRDRGTERRPRKRSKVESALKEEEIREEVAGLESCADQQGQQEDGIEENSSSPRGKGSNSFIPAVDHYERERHRDQHVQKEKEVES